MKRALDVAFLAGLAAIYSALGWALGHQTSDVVRLIGLISYGGAVICLVGLLLRSLGLISLDVIEWDRWLRPRSRQN